MNYSDCRASALESAEMSFMLGFGFLKFRGLLFDRVLLFCPL